MLPAPGFAWYPEPPPAVIMPAQPVPPPPPPSPTQPAVIDASTVYVFRATVDVVAVASPADVLKITRDAGPLKFRAKFYGGSGSYETQTFTEKWIYTVEGLKTGTAELIVVAGDQVIRRTIQVTDNPPGPGPGPGPGPSPDPLVQALQKAYDAETDAKKAMRVAALAAYLPSVVSSVKAGGKVTTLQGLQKAVTAGEAAIFSDGNLPLVRKAGSEYVASKLPKVDQTLTDATWAQAAQAYADVATAIAKVKP